MRSVPGCREILTIFSAGEIWMRGTRWCIPGVFLLLIAGTAICGCVAGDEEYAEASALYEHAGMVLEGIDWENSPPELIDAKLQQAEVDLTEALAIADAIQPDADSTEPSAAYALRELILAKLAYVSAAREVAAAQMHILNAGEAAEMYQYGEWHLEMNAARGNLDLATTSLSFSDTRMDGVNMTLVPVEMRSDVAEAKALNDNFDRLIISLRQSIESALES